MDKTPLYIQILKDEAVDRTAKFAQEHVIIGSGPAAHLRLDDHKVSRIHAMLKLEDDGQLKLSDLGWSDEGTLLDGVKIAEEMVLSDGARVQIGDTVLCVYRTAPGEQAAPPAASPSSSAFAAASEDSGSNPLDMLSADNLLSVEEETGTNPGLKNDPFAGASLNLGDEEDIFPEHTEVTSGGVGIRMPSAEELAPKAPEAAPSHDDLTFEPPEVEPASDPAPALAAVEPAADPEPVVAPSTPEIEDVQPVAAAPAPVEPVAPAPAPPVAVEETPLPAEEVLPPVPDSPEPAMAEPQATGNVYAMHDPGPIPEDQLPGHVRKHMVQENTAKRNLQVRFIWQGTVVDIGHFDKPRIVTVGSHPLNDFSIADGHFPDHNFPLVVPAEGGFGAFFTEKFEGNITRKDGSSQSLADIRSSLSMKKAGGVQGYVYALRDDETLTLQSSDLEIEFSFTHPTAAYSTAVYRDWDFLYWRITSFSFIFHLSLVLMFQFVPSKPLAERVLKGRFAKLIVVPPPEVPKKKKKKEFKVKKKEIKKEVKPDKSSKPTKDNSPVDSKTRDNQRIKKAGLLGLLNRGMGDMGPGGNLFGKATPNQFLGKMLGASSAGAAFGMGLSGRGFGHGGGGGGGMYGGGGGWGYGGKKRVYGRGGMNLKGRRKRKRRIRIQPGSLTLKGSLSKSQIARVVRQNWYQIRFCYESQLRKNPKLAGKIIIRWIIAGSGNVQTANTASTTMNNERVESCIVRRILRWKFPQPQGGGIVVVNYPFIFRVAG